MGPAVPAPDSALSVVTAGVKLLELRWTAVAGVDGYRLLEDPDGASGPATAREIARPPATATSHTLDAYLPEQIRALYLIESCRAGVCQPLGEASVSGDLRAAIGQLHGTNASFLGYSLALSAGGRILAAGAPGVTNNSGAVHLYVPAAGGRWQEQIQLKPTTTQPHDRFGTAVALSGDVSADGQTLVVGAPGEDSASGCGQPSADTALADSGAVYVYRRNGEQWSLQSFLKSVCAQAGDRLGTSVAISEDGQTLVASAPGHDGGLGVVLAFHLFDGTWQQGASLRASVPDGAAGFGRALTISADGHRVAVGAPTEGGGGQGVSPVGQAGVALKSGAVHVFERTGLNSWTSTYIKAGNAAGGDRFGSSLALSADGRTLAVGAPNEGTNAAGLRTPVAGDSGAVYLFSDPSGGAGWRETDRLKAPNLSPSHSFGACVALSADGLRLVATVPSQRSAQAGIGGSDLQSPYWYGAAMPWRFTNSGWEPGPVLHAATPQAWSDFGATCAMAGDGQALAVGAPMYSNTVYDPVLKTNDGSGAVFLY